MRKILILIISLPLLLLGAEWQSLDGPPLGRADDITIGYDPDIPAWVIFAADNTHKLYKSTDMVNPLGEHWEVPTDDERVDDPICVITDENNAQIIYIGKNDATPVWKSINGGEDWVERSTGITNTNPRCFAMHPNYSNKIYLGCEVSSGQPTMFKTTDGGADWSSLTNFPNVWVKDIAIAADPIAGTTILAGCSDGIYRSVDGGETWTQTLSASVSAVAFANQFLEDIVYAGGSNGVYKSTNGGVGWQLLDGSPGFVHTIAMVNVNTVYVGTTNGVYLTTDGGDTWQPINEGIYTKTMFSLIIHPENSQTLFAGGEKGIYKTLNAGKKWYKIIKGFKIKISENIQKSSIRVIKKLDYKDNF